MAENLTCWMYVSRSIIAPALATAAIADIVDVSRPRNELLDVTGALLFTGERFAQFLEGPATGVRELRASIERDTRHIAVKTIVESDTPVRRFAGWSLAYAGPSLFVGGAVEQVNRTPAEQDAVARLIGLLEEFADGKLHR